MLRDLEVAGIITLRAPYRTQDLEVLKEVLLEELTARLPQPIHGKDGIDGKDGSDGKVGVDGRNGKNGQDGKNGTDADENKIIGTILSKIPIPKDGRDGKDGETAKIDSKKLMADIIKEIKEGQHLDLSNIKGAQTFLMNGVRYKVEELMKGGGSSSGGSTGSIIAATNSGDNQNYTLAKAPTTAQYYALINNGMYTTNDAAFGFSVAGTTMTFNSALPSQLANTQIFLICV